MYRSVTFEPDEKEVRRPKWLDMRLVFDAGRTANGLRLELAQPEDRLQAPWLGRWPGGERGFAVERGTLLGVVARAEQLDLDAAATAQALGGRVRRLFQAGFPPRAVRALVHSVGSQGRGLRAVQRAVRAVAVAPASGA